MSKVEELLEKYNPDGVPNKLLVECSLIDYGYPFTSSMFTDDSSYIPIIRIRDVKPGKASTYYMGNYSKEYIVKRGDILVGMDGEFNLEKWNDIDSLLNQRVARITEMPSKSIKGYLYHILGPIFKKIEREISGGSVKHLSVKIINSISIPLPHIKVQEEIVKILDSFTNLIDALNEELSLRQKQLEYYRDQLYDDLFKKTKGVDVLCFSELGQIERGKRFVRDDIKSHGQPCIHYGDMYTFYGVKSNKAKTYLDRDFPKKMRYADIGDVIIVGAGENNWDIGVGLAWLGEEPAAVHDACYIVKHNNNPLFIAYYTRTTEYHQQLKKCVSEGKICSFSAEGLGKVTIPIPSLAVQQSIVEKLDAFESLIASLKEEIALRQKQYEYYREKLLTFD